MRVLLSTLLTSALASIDVDETGLLQQRISLDEASKTVSDLDVDCKHGLHKCDKKTPPAPRPRPAPPRPRPAPPRPRPAPPPPAGPVAECKVWGDPQVVTFDGLHSSRFHCKDPKRNNQWRSWDDRTIDSYKDGEYYLLKSSEIEIQGRFGAGGGTHRSMQREVALKVGDEVLQVRPDSIWFNDAFSNGGTFAKITDAAGDFTITRKPRSAWLSITHASVPFKLWLQQVSGGSPAVQALLYKAQGQLTSGTSVTGLCGNHDGDKQNDCTGMINDVNLVPEESSIFMAKPFDFAGCASGKRGDKLSHGWRSMGWVSNAHTCAMKCKGFQVYYPEFLIKKSHGKIECHCANLHASANDRHWRAHVMSPDQMNSLPASLGAGSRGGATCSESSCLAVSPNLPDQWYGVCIFSEKKKTVPKECPDFKRNAFQKKCEQDFHTDDAVAACVIDMCQSDDADAAEAQDVAFEKEAQQQRNEEQKSWKNPQFQQWFNAQFSR